jgi:type I restriction enzyme S subunit
LKHQLRLALSNPCPVAPRGELVPQDPNDEPASVLLERIKAEQVKQGIKKKSKRNNR